MAIAANTLLEFYSSDELIELRRLVLLYNLTTRQHTQQFEAGTAAKEYAISVTDPTTADRGRDANWGTAIDGTTDARRD